MKELLGHESDEVWQHAPRFASTNLAMLERAILCDVTLVAGRGAARVPCHRFILASRSPVFYTMFCGALPETGPDVNIPDIRENVLREFIKFLYSGACEVNADTVMELTYAASKYDVMTLLRQCITYLEENVNSETVCTILNHAIMFEENMLADRCLMYISKHSTAVFQSENFISLTKDALKDILELEKLNCDELKVYHACKRWATVSNEDTSGKTTKSGVNIRKQLGDLLQLVRFPTMDLEEFNEHVLADDVLTTLEINDIQTAIHNSQECPGFSSKRRHPKSNAPIKIETSNRVERGWGCGSKIQEGLTFTLSREMTLRAVGLYLPCVGGSVNGMLSIENDGNVVLCEKVRLRYDKDEKITYRRLAKTIPLTPEHTYVIKFKTEGTCTWLSRLEYETQTISGVDVQFLPELVTDPAYCQIHGFELSTS